MPGTVPESAPTSLRSTGLPLRVLGIDPGLAVTGYGVVDERGSGGTLVASGAVRTSAKAPRAERLGRIYDAVRALIDEHRPHEVAIEQQFVAENVRSAMAIGEARAAAMVAAAASALPVYEFAPRSVKESVTGWGAAPKQQVRQMVLVHLGLSELEGTLDVTDAIAIALARIADAQVEAAQARR
ncbi:MAG: crossover junction endodeoxyribonuclease RuvC [Dehalococcoidia bacterium]